MLANAAFGTRPAREQVVAALAGVALAVFLLGPRAAPGLVVVVTGAMLAASTVVDGRGFVARLSAVGASIPVLMLTAFGGWALLAVMWSVDRIEALGKVAQFAAALTAVAAVGSVRADLSDRVVRDMARAALVAFAAGLMFLAVEELTGHAIKRFVFTLLTWARPSTKHIAVAVDSGDVTQIAGYISNRNMAALSLTLWPVLLIAWRLVDAGRRGLVAASLAAVAAGTIALSQHDTSVLAFVGAAVVGIAMLRYARMALAAVAIGWVVATMAVVPITDWAFRSAQLHQASWLPHTARQRIILWGYTAQQVALRPLLGVGTDSTKTLDARRGPRVETPAGFGYQWRTGPHAHNIYLQTWYELGLPGALLLCAVGLAVLRAIAGLPSRVQPFMAAAFVSAAITAAFTWGLWQAWFMAAFTLSAILCLLALELDRRLDSRG